MKLGFKLRITNEGVQDVLAFNKEQSWSNYVADIRSVIQSLNGLDGTGKIVYLLRFLGKEGYLFTIIKARFGQNGRPNDNSAAWIHVPANVSVSGREMKALLDEITVAISGKYVTDEEKIKEAFEKDYPEKRVASTVVSRIESNQAAGYATIYFGHGTQYNLEELLGDAIAQTEYSEYKGIVFVDKDSGITSTGKVIEPGPKKVLVYGSLAMIDGFIPYLDGQRIDEKNNQIEVLEGDTLTVVWKRVGYVDIKKTCTAQKIGTEGVQEWSSSIKIHPNEYKVIIRRDMFDVIDKKDNKHLKAQIKVGGRQLNDTLEISKAGYEQGLSVEVKVDGYKDYKEEGVSDLIEKKHAIQMERVEYSCDYSVDVYKDGKRKGEGKITVTSEYEIDKYQSPLKGYKLQDGSITYNPSFSWKNFVVGILLGIVISVVAGVVLLNMFILDGKVMQDGGQNRASVSAIQPTIEDLLNKSHWKRDEFEKAGYAGLWDDLNKYEFSKVKGYDFNSQNFRGVKKLIEEKKENNLFVRTYCEKEDYTINVANYKKRLEKNLKEILEKETWNKNELEAIPDIKGLWDAVNTYNLDKLKNDFKDLQGIKNYDDIVSVLEDNNQRVENLKQKNNGAYCSGNDFNIVILNYINTVKKQQPKLGGGGDDKNTPPDNRDM